MNKVFRISIVLFLLLISFNGCSYSVSEVKGNPYSRENTIDLINGFSPSDYDYVICKFVYNNEEFIELYGNDFEIVDIIGSSDLHQFMWLFKGVSHCSVYIKKDVWRVNLKKEYFSDWKVTECYKDNN